MASNCGGCQGQGSHRRWCVNKVGPIASVYGSASETAESLGDRVGSNDPGIANRFYALAGELREMAEEAKR